MSRLIGIVFAFVHRVGAGLDEPPTQLATRFTWMGTCKPIGDTRLVPEGEKPP